MPDESEADLVREPSLADAPVPLGALAVLIAGSLALFALIVTGGVIGAIGLWTGRITI